MNSYYFQLQANEIIYESEQLIRKYKQIMQEVRKIEIFREEKS